MRIYISGPITGMPNLNREAFRDAAIELALAGYTPVSPFDNGVVAHADWKEHMRADIKMLVDCDGVCLLSGWHKSKGTNIECDIAIGLGMSVRELSNWLA